MNKNELDWNKWGRGCCEKKVTSFLGFAFGVYPPTLPPALYDVSVWIKEFIYL